MAPFLASYNHHHFLLPTAGAPAAPTRSSSSLTSTLLLASLWPCSSSILSRHNAFQLKPSPSPSLMLAHRLAHRLAQHRTLQQHKQLISASSSSSSLLAVRVALVDSSRDPAAPQTHAAVHVLATRELLEHITDFATGVPSLLTTFVHGHGCESSDASASLSPFIDTADDDDSTDYYSASFDPQAANGRVARLAIQHNNRRVLQLLLRLNTFDTYRRVRQLRLDMVVIWCIELGRLELLEWLRPQLPSSVTTLKCVRQQQLPLLLDSAIRNGDVAAMDWIQRHCALECCTVSPNALCAVPPMRACDVVEWLVANGYSAECLSDDVVADLAARGCRDALAFIHSQCEELQQSHQQLFSTRTMDAAAHAGQLDVVSFLHTHRTDGCTTHAMDDAAANGHLSVVEFLHAHRTEGCTTDAIDIAASNGHVEVVEFLYANRTEGATSAAIECAALHGHASIVAFLHHSQAVSCTPQALDNAAANGHLDIVRYFHDRSSDGCTTRAMNMAAANGHLAVVEFLHEHRTDGCTRAAMDLAARNGHLAVVQFLHEHRTEGCTKRALTMAARNGHLSVVQFLLEHRREGCAEEALRGACSSGRFEVARFLHSRGFMGDVAKCVVSCCCATLARSSSRRWC